MPTSNPSTKLANTGSMLKTSAIHGGKVGLADEAGDALLAVARAALGDRYPELLTTPMGEDIAKLLTASLVHFAVGEMPDLADATGKNGAKRIQRACGYIVESVAQRRVRPLIKPMRSQMVTLMKLGAQLDANADADADADAGGVAE